MTSISRSACILVLRPFNETDLPLQKCRPVTLKSAYNFLKQGGHATSRDAVRNYVAWAEDSWLMFSVPIHTDSQKELERNYKRIYCIKWALAIRNSLVWDGSNVCALENMVYLELCRRYARFRCYLTGTRPQEVDFVASDGRGKPVLVMQVSMDISHHNTLRRELVPLIAAARYFGAEENLIVTLSQERRFDQEGVTFHAIPAWRWLLAQELY